MKSNKLQPVWKSVNEPFIGNEYECFTLVRVEGWVRFGFGRNDGFGWHLNADPSAYTPSAREEAAKKITHWLAVPRSTKTQLVEVSKQYAWKVVARNRETGQRISVCTALPEKNYPDNQRVGVIYKPNEWTKPLPEAAVQALFVFATRAAARKFINRGLTQEIWKCEVKGVTDHVEGYSFGGGRLDVRTPNGLPAGTRWASEVKLVSKDK